MTELAIGAAYWFGSGVAFAVGVVCGVAMCRISGRDSSRQLAAMRADREAWQADRDERMPYLVRGTNALEQMAGVVSKEVIDD